MDRTDYIQKCTDLLSSSQFKLLTTDPTRPTERKLQSLLRKIKSNIPEHLYKKLYPTGSNPGKFYSTAKIHKLKAGEGIDKLPLRPIVSNIGTATYQTAKYLAKLLAPFKNTSTYSIGSTKDFLKECESISIAEDEEMVSFDVVGLFTNVPLKHTIKNIITRIYDKGEIKTD